MKAVELAGSEKDCCCKIAISQVTPLVGCPVPHALNLTMGSTTAGTQPMGCPNRYAELSGEVSERSVLSPP